MSHKKCNPVSQIVSTTFHPLPTIKTIRKNAEKQIIYYAAHYLFRKYPMNKPLLIYKHHRDRISYDFYVERTESGWKDMVYTHPIESSTNKIIYIADGLSSVIKEETEFQPHLSHISQQIGMMCRLLEL
jgi:hypothetical protein